MRSTVLVFLFSLFAISGFGQQQKWSPLSQIAVEGLDLVSLDIRGNIFYSDTDGNVFKLDDSEQVVNHYSPVLQGRLSQLDAFSTVVLFLFSADLQQVTLLDSHLSPVQTISFQDEAIGIVKAAALGNNHIFWLFDEVDLSLKKYDYRRGEILQVQPLAPLLGGDEIEVVEILERQNLVLMNIKDRGVYVFDNQANLIKKHDLRLNQPLAVYNGHIYFVQNNHIHRMDIYSGEESVLKLPNLLANSVAVSAHRLLFYSHRSLFILPMQAF